MALPRPFLKNLLSKSVNTIIDCLCNEINLCLRIFIKIWNRYIIRKLLFKMKEIFHGLKLFGTFQASLSNSFWPSDVWGKTKINSYNIKMNVSFFFCKKFTLDTFTSLYEIHKKRIYLFLFNIKFRMKVCQFYCFQNFK